MLEKIVTIVKETKSLAGIAALAGLAVLVWSDYKRGYEALNVALILYVILAGVYGMIASWLAIRDKV
jgi:hypothetical protein